MTKGSWGKLMKKFKQFKIRQTILSILLIAALILPLCSGIGIRAEAKEKETNVYKIYPIPQSVVYENGEFAMSDTVNVIYEGDIDEATKKFLEEVITNYGKTVVQAEDIADGETTILLGTNGSSGKASDYVDKNVTIKTDDLFSKTDSYVLSAKDNVISIVGKDSDSTFYGVATLQMMLKSYDSPQLRNVQIEDFAGIEYRGFIEGFYGGWDYKSRESLMRFARDVKMNNYVYASKTDPYHTNKWGELYPQNEIDQIKELVKVGEETKCYYAWSVHISGFFSGLDTSNETAYNERYEKLLAKFQQLYDAGVRKFDILNDDFGSGTHEDVVNLLNKLTTEFIQPKNCKPITYCMQGYNKGWANAAELEALKALDSSIILYWTGDDVNSPITQETINYVSEKTGHKVCFWLNYPVNEHAKSGIYLGDITHYARDGVTGLTGAVSNPSRFAQSNKIGLFQLASLFWNNTDYSEHAQTIWQDAFLYVEPEVQDAYFKIASNIANCPHSSRVPQGFPESEYLKEKLESVMEKVNTGELLKDDKETANLQAEFDSILKAIETFNVDCKNEDLKSELSPWLHSLKDIVSGAKAIIESVIAIQEKDTNTAWVKFAAAGKALETWNTYPTAEGETTMAEAGSKRLHPFVSSMTLWAKNALTPLFDPNNTDVTPSFYAVLGGVKQTDDANSANLFDQDLTTAGKWQQNQKTGDYYGVDLGRIIPITDITIVQGTTDTDHDYFHNFILEYSETGSDGSWTAIQEYKETDAAQHIEKSGLDIKARYIRIRLTKTGTITPAKENYWTNVREFTVNKKVEEGERIYTNIESLKKTPLHVLGNEFRVKDLKNIELKPNEYIGIKMTSLTSVSAISYKADGLAGAKIQYSLNGIEWTDAADFNEPQIMRYIRIVNPTEKAITGTLTKLGISANNLKITPTMSETSFTNPLREGKWEYMFDGDISTYAWTNQGQNKDDYIIVDLGVLTSLYDVTIATWDGKAHLYDADIQISADKNKWRTIASVKDDNTKVEPPCRYVRGNGEGEQARYIRILITDQVASKYDNPFLRIHEIEVNKNVEKDISTSPVISSASGDLDKCIDKDISTVFTTTDSEAGWLEYRLTDHTKLNSISLLQDAQEISNASVKVRTGVDKWEELGSFDQGTKTFDTSKYDHIFAIRLEWTDGKAPSVYEIYTDEDSLQDTDDIGIYVEHIIDTEPDPEEPEQPEIPDSENLALKRPVEVSGTELNGDQKDFAVDGNRDTRWNSNYIKGSQADKEAWIIVDLGETTNIIESLTAEYFNLVYPTDYEVLVSADKEDWITAKTLKYEPNGAAHPTHEITLDQPIVGRYVKLLFHELNSAAIGNCVGLEELTITGKRISSETELKEYLPINDIKIDKGTSEKELKKLLPSLITGKLALKNSDNTLDPASLFVNWDLSKYNADQDATLVLNGNLIGAGKVSNNEISLTLIIGTGETTPPVEPEDPDVEKIQQLKQELSSLIASAKEKTESDQYTDDSVAALKKEITNAEALLSNEKLTVEQLQQQINGLKKAIDGLTKKDSTENLTPDDTDKDTNNNNNNNNNNNTNNNRIPDNKNSAVETGDNTPIIPLLFLFICSGTFLIVFRKKYFIKNK